MAKLEAFADGGCSHKSEVLQLSLTTTGSSCGNLPSAGVPLGSKQVTLAYAVGACAPGGEGRRARASAS